MSDTSPTAAIVLVPVKAFDRAKGRLAGRLEPAERAGLARAMAEVVLAAAAPLEAVVVCDDDEVARWARSHGAGVSWTPGLGLNDAVSAALREAEEAGVRRAVVAHADLPFAHGLAGLADVGADTVVLVGDRHGDGTNVMSLPLGRGMGVHYGPGSLGAHRRAAQAAELEVREVRDEALAWDVDGPADLEPPAHLGTLSPAVPRPA